MASRFEEALERNRPAQKLGDVSIRYETSLLIAETARLGGGTMLPTLLQSLAVVGAGLALVGLLEKEGHTLALSGVVLCALALWASTQVHTRNRQRRRFVLNYATYTLRLDFSSPIANTPRTMNIDFGNVRDVSLVQQADDRWCLLVDFVRVFESKTLYREVLIANISALEKGAAERFQQTLQAAFLEKNAEEAPVDDGPVDSFTPGG